MKDAREATQITTLNLLFHAQKALGSLGRIDRVVEVMGFVRTVADFGQQPTVLDACSQMLIDVFGEVRGQHARCAIGAFSLPVQIPVEIKMVMHVSTRTTAK